MNSTSHTISFTKEEGLLLITLSRQHLTAGIHSAVTAKGLEDIQRTMYAVAQADAHVLLCELLGWRATDAGKAIRTTPSAIVVSLMDLLSSAVPGLLGRRTALDLGRLGSELHVMLQKSLSSTATKGFTYSSTQATA